MRVQLEYKDKTVDIEDRYIIYPSEKDFINLVERALKAIGIDAEVKING